MENTRGFITRKVRRLECDRKRDEIRIQELTKKIQSLIELRDRVQRNLERVNGDIAKLTPRLKCETIKRAAPLKMEDLINKMTPLF